MLAELPGGVRGELIGRIGRGEERVLHPRFWRKGEQT
jgi:hypothetical protein